MAKEETAVVLNTTTVQQEKCSPFEVLNWFYGIIVLSVLTATITVIVFGIKSEYNHVKADLLSCTETNYNDG